jgi:hypothetical protein
MSENMLAMGFSSNILESSIQREKAFHARAFKIDKT